MAHLVQALGSFIGWWVGVPARWLTELMDDADAVWDLTDPLLSGD